VFGLNNESTQILINAIKTALYDESSFLATVINHTGLWYFLVIAVGVTMLGHVYRLIFRTGGVYDRGAMPDYFQPLAPADTPTGMAAGGSADGWGKYSADETAEIVRRAEEAYLRGDD